MLRFDDQARLVLPRTAHKGGRPPRAGPARARRPQDRAQRRASTTAASTCAESPGGRGALVLITDGLDEDSAVDLDDGLRVAEGAQIPVYTVGVGKVQEKRLRRIAKLTGGEYAPIADASGAAIAKRIAAQAAAMPVASAPEGARHCPPRSRPCRPSRRGRQRSRPSHGRSRAGGGWS